MKRADVKLQRWIDLIAALLSVRYGRTFEELKRDVPAYAQAKHPSAARMFERDKDDLRAHGVPIRIREDDAATGTEQRYYVRPSEMYLPYLALASSTARPHRANVPTLTFEPSELSVLLLAARRTEELDEPPLALDAQSAVRKLTYDLGAGAVVGDAEDHAVVPAELSSARTVSVLGNALLRRKRAKFTYHSMHRDAVGAREVEPYGLFFLGGHWYLAARDPSIDQVRSFRVSRMRDVSISGKKPQSVDYDIPKDFKLAEHARVRESWEIGDETPDEMIVEFRGESGATVAARSLGSEVPGSRNRRKFHVRRSDSFVRWIMSFAGEVIPVSPPRLVEEYASMVAETAARYSR